MAQLPEISDANFDEKTREGIVVVDFSAEWCGPCKALAPLLEQVAKEVEGTASVYKVDIDSSQSVTERFGVTSVPTLVFFRAGAEVDRIVGVAPAEEIKAKVDALQS